MKEEYCHFALTVEPGSRYAIWSNFDEKNCCGKLARFLAHGCLPVCAEHYDLIEATDADRDRR